MKEQPVVTDHNLIRAMEKMFGHQPTKPRYTKTPKDVMKTKARRRNAIAKSSRRANR